MLNFVKHSSKMSFKLAKYYRNAMSALTGTAEERPIVVEFYPYVNAKHTIRVRNGKIFVRVSDSFEDAPEEVHEALAFILSGKLTGKHPGRENLEVFNKFSTKPDYIDKVVENRAKRGRKEIGSPVGSRFNLDELFHRLNQAYFGSHLPKPALGWSVKKSFRRLGHFDPVHNAIVISRTLDAQGVPEYVTAYVLFHEMLHMIHKPEIKNGRRYPHTKKFREDEMMFEFFEEAEDWIANNSLKTLAQRGF